MSRAAVSAARRWRSPGLPRSDRRPARYSRDEPRRLATGGLGFLCRHTTNPTGSLGHGLALAARGGCRARRYGIRAIPSDRLDSGRDPMPLVSEALRGEGAVLIDETGARFTRRACSRAMSSRAPCGRTRRRHRVFSMRARRSARAFAQRFPGHRRTLPPVGIDPATMPIPVRPAAHYHMGGIAVDSRPQLGRGALGLRRGCGHRPPRRQSSRQQFAARGCGRAGVGSPTASRPRRPARRARCRRWRCRRRPIRCRYARSWT